MLTREPKRLVFTACNIGNKTQYDQLGLISFHLLNLYWLILKFALNE